MWRQVSSTVRFCAMRIQCLILAKACSIGLRSGGIGRQVPEPGASGPDHAAQGCRLVAAEIVQNDDVAGLERRHQLLLDIGPEAFAVDRTIEDARGREPIAAQGAEEGQRAPVAVRCEPPQAFSLRPPAAQRGHAGLDPGLVDEDKAPGIETGLP